MSYIICICGAEDCPSCHPENRRALQAMRCHDEDDIDIDDEESFDLAAEDDRLDTHYHRLP